MLSPPDLSKVLHLLESVEGELDRLRMQARRRARRLAVAGKICSGAAVLSLAGWVLAQTVEIRTDNGAAAESQRFKVETGAPTVNSYFVNSRLGIGTSTPGFNVHLLGTADPAAFTVDGVGAAVGPNFIGRRARGTPGGGETSIQAGDNLAVFQGRGYGTTGYSAGSRAKIELSAAQNWTDAAQGTNIVFYTTASATAAVFEKMRITEKGDVRMTAGGATGAQFQLAPQTGAAPAAVGAGALYFDDDDDKIYYHSGSAWAEFIGPPGAAGTVYPFAGAAAPPGWLLCDGAAVSRATYAGLFAAIGTTYGAGDGSTTFNLPDLRSRAPIGAGQGTGLTNRPLAGQVGGETKTLATADLAAHTHTGTTNNPGDHAHTQTATPWVVWDTDRGVNGGWSVFSGDNAANYGTSANGDHSHTFTSGSTGSASAFSLMQPSIALNFVIRY